MIGCIYTIRNKINNKLYVGQTISKLSNRWAVHCNKNNNSNSAITKSIIKYGKENFEIVPIEIVEDDTKEILIEKLNLLEKSYIYALNTLLPNGYNILSGGKNTPKPESIKRKISKALKGTSSRKYWLGKSFSKEHKKKLSDNNGQSIPIMCNETKAIFKSAAEAARVMNIPRPSISACLRKNRKYKNTFSFSYIGNKNAKT